jgi:recombination protein RecR
MQMTEKSSGSGGVIATLIDQFAALPGIGRKSAERLAYHVMKMPAEDALGFADAVRAVTERLHPCTRCFNLCEDDTCEICRDSRRDTGLLLVVEQVRDLLALETAGSYRGLYHVLQGRLSPLDGVAAEQLTMKQLLQRVRGGQVREVIMGTSPTVEGDATAAEIAGRLADLPVVVTRLARGLVVGSPLEQANKAMLADALSGRHRL